MTDLCRMLVNYERWLSESLVLLIGALEDGINMQHCTFQEIVRHHATSFLHHQFFGPRYKSLDRLQYQCDLHIH